MIERRNARTTPLLFSLLALFAPACAAGGGASATPHHSGHPGVTPGLGAIRGVVRDVGTGEPISFVTVYAHSPLLHRERSATTEGNGTYRLGELDPGRYRITAYYSDATARYDDVAVRAGKETTVDIRLRATGEADTASIRSTTASPATDGEAAAPRAPLHSRTGIIEGKVFDGASGASLPGAVVAATAPHLRDARLAMADDQGGFRLLGLPPGSYTLSVYYHLIDRGNIEIRKANVEVRPGRTVEVDLKLDAKPYD